MEDTLPHKVTSDLRTSTRRSPDVTKKVSVNRSNEVSSRRQFAEIGQRHSELSWPRLRSRLTAMQRTV